MKQVVIIDNKKFEREIPNKEHLAIQCKYRTQIVVPKKGKGSFKRNPKYKEW